MDEALPASAPLINDTVQPGPSGFQATKTVRLRDLNGDLGVVEVDTMKSDKVLTIQLHQTPAEKPQYSYRKID